MFINASLLDRVAYGFTSTSTWATTRYRLISGRSKRNAQRSMPLYIFKAPYNNINITYASQVVAAYNACLGPVHSFRFKDWSDFELDDVIIGTAVGGVDETMQLVKPYTFGTQTLNRIITKPLAGIALTEDDVSMSSAVDTLTGIVTFTSTAGKVIRATGEFDIPVQFDDDDLDMDYDTWEHLTADIILTEDFNA